MTTFNASVTLLKIEEGSFKADDGRPVNYTRATLLLPDGEIVKVPVGKGAIADLREIRNKSGLGQFSIAGGFKDKLRVELVGFTPGK